jgi:putative membrane protein
MSVTHTFLDFLPSTFLGAPDEKNIMSALPAHRLLLKGRAYEAIRLSVIGSLGCLVLGVILTPIFYVFIKYVYPFLEVIMFWILIVAVGFVIFKDKRRWVSLAFFFIAGGLGYIALNLPLIENPLFPLLSGLFGVSTLIKSYFDKINIPKQKEDFEIVLLKDKCSAIFGGTAAGSMTGFMPGLGTSQGATIAFSCLDLKENGFIIITAGIGTVNFVLSIITYYTIEKARNGSIVVASQLAEFSLLNIAVFLCVVLISGGIAAILALYIGKFFGRFITKVNYQKLVISIIALIFICGMLFSNIYGEILLICSTTLGLVGDKFGIAKNHLMGCLMVPVLIYFGSILM